MTYCLLCSAVGLGVFVVVSHSIRETNLFLPIERVQLTHGSCFAPA